jgi:hypothetical protein
MNKRIIAELTWGKSAFGDSSGTLLILYTQILNLKLQLDKIYIKLQSKCLIFYINRAGTEHGHAMHTAKYVSLDTLK